MNLSQIPEQYDHDREGTKTSAARHWLRALTMSLTRRVGGKRRPTGVNSRQLESLEPRQLLSVANPALPVVDVVASPADAQNPAGAGTLSERGYLTSDALQAGPEGESPAGPSAPLSLTIADVVLQPPSDMSGTVDEISFDPVVPNRDTAEHGPLNPSVSPGDPAIVAPVTAVQDHPASVTEPFVSSETLIDEVFCNSQSILGDSSLNGIGAFPLQSGNLRRATNPVGDQTGAMTDASSRSKPSAEMFGLETLFAVQAPESQREQFDCAARVFQNDYGDSSFLIASLATAPSENDHGVLPDGLPGLATEESESAASATRMEFSVAQAHWLLWLSDDTRELSVSLHQSDLRSPLDGHFVGKSVPLLNESSGPAQAPQATSSQVQTQSRKFRENHRQAFVREQVESTAPDEFEPPQSLEAGSIPRQLKFFVDPRGPPIYGRDADVPFPETNAPADLLERLRYSIAPRGPSLVTVEMQSPEYPSFSGPRISPKEL